MKTVKNPLRVDPTRTSTLRRQFETEMVRRFTKFRRKLVSLIVDEDAFGLREQNKPWNPVINAKFSSTQLDVTDPECLRRIRELQGRLDPADVIELETEPHVTVRYGLHGQDPEVVQKLLTESGPIWMTIGRLSLFQQPEHDVLKLDVESKGLERLNAELGKLPNTQTHDEYVPHLTIALLKPGTGWKYLSDPSFLEWQSYVFTELTFSDRERNQTKITLNNKYTFDAEDCPKCGASMEGDSYSGKCNSCGHLWGKLVENITQNTRWSFRSSPEKIKEFLKWLEGNLRPILTDEATTEDDWWNKYVMEGFKKGAARSYDDMKKAGAIPQSKLPFYLGQKEEFLRSAFRQPESVEKVKLLAGRVYTELKGVTEAMSQNLTRTLTDGLVQGMNPRQIATNIIKDVNGIGIRRARVIAQTEIIRAHAEGQLDSMQRLGVKKLAVMVEWGTADDDRVCKVCQPLEGVVLTMDEAKGLIPRHPGCRCTWLPANVGEDQEEQVRGAARIKRAITKSLVAGKPKRGKSKSSWAGAKRKISSFRPKSRV